LVNGVLHLELVGWSKLLALSGSLDIALPCIKSAANYMEFHIDLRPRSDWPERMSYQALAGEMKEAGHSTVKVSIFSLGVIPVPNSARFLDWKVKLLSNMRGRVANGDCAAFPSPRSDAPLGRSVCFRSGIFARHSPDSRLVGRDLPSLGVPAANEIRSQPTR